MIVDGDWKYSLCTDWNARRNQLLKMSSGIHEFGSIRWELLACLTVAWVLVYFCIWKGLKSTGKVVYVTATLPYVLIIAFLGLIAIHYPVKPSKTQ